MAILEAQLDDWSAIGAQQTSKDTHTSIRAILDSTDAPYHFRQPTTFLQGSYRNDTNIRAESDVDIVTKTQSIFYYDISALSAADQEEYRKNTPAANYSVPQFKSEVMDWLHLHYGTDLDTTGNKALTIAARNNRRKADILVCATFKRYYYAGFMGIQFVEGIKFFTNDGQWVENYPVLHSDNLTARHQESDGWLKPTIRILKNMRNRARDAGILPQGVAPSYYIEGLLYNVPLDCFGRSYSDTIFACLRWLRTNDRTMFMCANGQQLLLARNSATSWDPDHCRNFLDGLAILWDTWR